MTNAFVPSVQQNIFFDWLERGKGSANLVACAGAGKSTTIRQGLLRIPEHRSVLMLSFNATITKENKEKVAELGKDHGRAFRGVSIKTFHGLGFGAIMKRLNKRFGELEVDRRKIRKIVDLWLGELDRELYGPFIIKLVGLAMGDGIGAIAPDTWERWYGLVQHHDLYLDSEEADEDHAIELARELLRRNNEAADEGHISFDDQIYQPLRWKLRLWQNDFVFIDEAQDTNPCRRALAKLALKPGGRLIAVGDPNQAIYGFTGASHDAMDIIKREFSCVTMNLSVSYRCSRVAVARARTLVSHIEPHENAAEGIERELDGLDDALKTLGPKDAILCRQTAPLIDLAYKAMARGVGVTVLGREIGEGLVNLIKAMRARSVDPKRDAEGNGDGRSLVERLQAFQEREQAKFMAKGEEEKAEGVADRVDCIMTAIRHLPENKRTVSELVARITAMFSDESGTLTLSTIHKVKGAEYPNVCIYRPELCPSKWARQEHQHQQELNLQYVAWTRTKGGLYELRDAA